MNKLANMRHWPEKMSPNFGMSRAPPPVMGMASMNPHHKLTPQPVAPIAPQPTDPNIHYSFNVPFASDLAGPDTQDILHATADAVMRWTHPEDAPDDVPIHELPVHTQNLARLQQLCKDLTQSPLSIEAHVITSVPQPGRGQVLTVVLSGAPELVYKSRETILNETPLSLRCTTVDVAGDLVCDLAAGVLKAPVTQALDEISAFCGVDIFLLGPSLEPLVPGAEVSLEMRQEQRWRLAIYGDYLSTEHAKTRVLVHIDKLLGRVVDSAKFELSLHQLLCGRNRKNIKLIEAMTNTAIYFPPPFSHLFHYCPPKAQRRDPQEIIITGENMQAVKMAQVKLHETLSMMRLFAKDIMLPPAKIDNILMSRMDKVRKIVESNGTFILFPPIGSKQETVRVQGMENIHVDRTVRDIMSLAGQFYTASWWISLTETRAPLAPEIRATLADICANSDADVSYENPSTFTVTGSDDAVKAALVVISRLKLAARARYQVRVEIELANEHKEFVSGKKNGKINKIMGQSNVQIMFNNFGDYNFNIDVLASDFDSLMQGLSLVEQEMPASISFHVPDQYHKRIIGIGGQHIQRIMKKYSVFVKFSNAMDRGGLGREDDDCRVDNVVCRTPARNAQNLELVKNDILEMVDRNDSEFTSQTVNIDRLYHRQLLAHWIEMEELEKKWNCKIVFPSTEQASHEVAITGPQWQVSMCIDDLLGMVPANHRLVMKRTPELMKFLESSDFRDTLLPKLKTQHEVVLTVHNDVELQLTEEDAGPTVTLLWTFTSNNAGGLKDAIDFLHAQLATAGVEATVVKGSIPRPRVDKFEDSLQYFDSKLLQQAPAPVNNSSPTDPAFDEEVARERSTILDKLRKPGSMSTISAFLDRRKNSSQRLNKAFFGSTNVSKSSLISIESTRSFNLDRNPWNDSGVNLPDDDNQWALGRSLGNGVTFDLKLSMCTSTTTPTHTGDLTPRHHAGPSIDSGRPSTSHSTHSGYPGHVLGPSYR